MKILITGGAGFIGSAVAREIIQSSEDSVVILDKLTYAGNLRNLDKITHSKRFWFEQADICSANCVRSVLQKHRPDRIMHLAAESHVDRSIFGPAAFMNTNILGTFTLLEEARHYLNDIDPVSRHNFRFHHVSTDEVFGDLPHPDENADAYFLKFTEDTPYSPSSPYSASKASSDHLVRAWFKTYEVPVLISNCSNNYGPYHHPEKLIPHTIINALSGKSIPVYGFGNQIRDWLFVEDHARALLSVIRKGKVGETYNIGGNNEERNINIVRSLCEILDKLTPKDTSYSDLIQFVSDRKGHDLRYSVNTAKIASTLNWAPDETLQTRLNKTEQLYLDNETWWKNILDKGYDLKRIGV